MVLESTPTLLHPQGQQTKKPEVFQVGMVQESKEMNLIVLDSSADISLLRHSMT